MELSRPLHAGKRKVKSRRSDMAKWQHQCSKLVNSFDVDILHKGMLGDIVEICHDDRIGISVIKQRI